MLKTTHDSLSKSWKPVKVWEPFYQGGKLQISKDGKRMACEYDGNIKLVDTSNTGSAERFFEEEEGTFEAVGCFAVHPNWKEIVIATVKFSLNHWIIEGRVLQKTMKAHRMPVLCMEYDLTGSLLATGSADRSVRVWDVARGYCTHVFSDHSDLIKSVVFFQPPVQGKGAKQQLFLASTSEDNSVALFDLVQQKKLAHFTSEHVSVPTKTVVACEGNLLVSCGRDKVLNVFSLKSLHHLKVVPVAEELEAMVALPPAVSKRLIDSNASTNTKPTSTRAGDSQQVVLTAGNKGVLRFYLVALRGSDPSTVEVQPFLAAPLSSLPQQHQAGASEEVAQLCGVTHIDYLSDSEEVFVSTNDFNLCRYSIEDLCTYIRDNSNHTTPLLPRLAPSKLLVGHHGDVLDIISLPHHDRSGSSEGETEGWRGVLVTNSPQLRLVSTSTTSSSSFDCDRIFEGHADIILAVDVSPDGQYIVTSSKDKTCRLWSTALGECIAIAEGHTDAIGAVVISHFHASYASRKAFVVSGASDKILKKWPLPLHSMATSSPVLPSAVVRLSASQSIRAHDKDINCVAVSPDDSLIASASQDKTIRLWSADDLSAVATLHGHKRGVWKALFSPHNDKLLLSCSGDRTVKLWSLTDYTVVKTLEGNTASVLNLRLTHEGEQVITAAADGLLRLFTLRSQECVSALEEHEDRVWAIDSFTRTTSASSYSTAYFLVSGGSDSKLVLWKDSTREDALLAIQEREEKLQCEQQLYNFINRKQYLQALQLALQLKYSQRVLSILQTIIEESSAAAAFDANATSLEETEGNPLDFQEKGGNSLNRISEKFQRLFEREWSRCLDSYLLQLSDAHRRQLVLFLKDWNSNSRHCYLCQLLFNAFLRLFPSSSLLNSSNSEWRELVPGFRAFTERHHNRVNRLLQASYYINYVIAAVQGFLPLETLNRITHLHNHNHSDTGSDEVGAGLVLQDQIKTEEEEEITYVITHAAVKEEEGRGKELEEDSIDEDDHENENETEADEEAAPIKGKKRSFAATDNVTSKGRKNSSKESKKRKGSAK